MGLNPAWLRHAGDLRLPVRIRAIVSPRTWTTMVNLVVGVPVALICILLTALVTVVTAGIGLPVAARFATAVHRSRYAALCSVTIPAMPIEPPRDPRGPVARTIGRIIAPTNRRMVGYLLLCLPVSALLGLLAVAPLCFGVVLGTVGVQRFLLPRSMTAGVGDQPYLAVTVMTLGGLLCLLATPTLVSIAGRADLAFTRALLEPDHAAMLARRVETLTASRAEAVEAADAERRRIERNLHDGTQQRLVSLAMNLGITRETEKDLSPAAMAAIVAAHEEAKQALAELREFVRGLHPAILDDLGLDAAMSGIAARCPVPVRLRVSLAERPPRPVETVAYFVVSEALTNVAKHANAQHVDVTVRTVDRHGVASLAIDIVDDGVGGASAERGTGLRGLASRVASVEGTFRVASPAGGPTTIAVELPCAS